MELMPKIPKPKDPLKKPPALRPFAVLATVILELPSSLLSIIFAIVIEFFILRTNGYRTDTIGDVSSFTSDDALPKPFFTNDEYDLSKLLEPSLAFDRLL